jgi:hypothetical protein
MKVSRHGTRPAFRAFAAAALLAATTSIGIITTATTSEPDSLYVDPGIALADSSAMEVIARLVVALTIEDEQERLQAVLPLVHASLKTRDGKDLSRSVKDYSYKVAVQYISLYRIPVEFVRVTERREGDIGFEATADRGFYQTYYISRTEEAGGMPPPVTVFFPSDGGPPKITSISL